MSPAEHPSCHALLFCHCLCLSPGSRDSRLLLGSSLDFASDTLTHITGICTLSSRGWQSLLASWLLSPSLALQRPDTNPSQLRASSEPASRPAGPALYLCLGQGRGDCSGSCCCREHHSPVPRAPHCSCPRVCTLATEGVAPGGGGLFLFLFLSVTTDSHYYFILISGVQHSG